MEANTYAEVTDGLAGQVVNFSGLVMSNTLTDAHIAYAFIKDFAPDYSSFVESKITLGGPGLFSLSLETSNELGRHVQWGFQMVGVNVWVTDVEPFGTIVFGRDPEVATDNASWGEIKSLYR